MKIFSKIITLWLILFLFFFHDARVYGFSPLNEIKEAAQKVKQTVSTVADKVQDKVEDVGDDLGDAAKDAAQGVKKVAGKVADKVEDLSEDVAKKLQKLGFPNPKELVKFAFNKMPKNTAKKLATKLFDFATVVAVNLQQTIGPVSKALDELYAPIPPLPTGIPLPLPSTPPGLPIAINTAIGISQSIAISRLQRESLDSLQAFHSVTNYKYFSEKEKALFLAKIKEPVKKQSLSKFIKIKDVEDKLQDAAKTARKPVEILRGIIKKVVPNLFKEIEPLKKTIEPVPLMALLPLGSSFNGGVFCFRLKEHRSHFRTITWRLENDLNPFPDQNIISLAELRKDRVMGIILKIIEKNPIRNIDPIQEMNEMFVDHLHELPWGMHSNIILFLKALNFFTEALDSATAAIIAAIVDAVSIGAAAGVSEAVGVVAAEVINASFVFEFVAAMFKWAYIRYLEARFNHMESLIEQVRADGFPFDSAFFKQELARIKAGQGPTNPVPDSVENEAKAPLSPVKPMTKPLKVVLPEIPGQDVLEKKNEPVQKVDVVEPAKSIKGDAPEKVAVLPSEPCLFEGDKVKPSEPVTLIDLSVQSKSDAAASKDSDAAMPEIPSVEKKLPEVSTQAADHKVEKIVHKKKKRRKQQKVRRRHLKRIQKIAQKKIQKKKRQRARKKRRAAITRKALQKENDTEK